MKQLYRAFVVGMMVAGAAGCASLQNLSTQIMKSADEHNDEALGRSEDKVLASAFWPSPFSQDTAVSRKTVIKSDTVTLEWGRFSFDRKLDGLISEHVRMGTENDAIADQYVATAKGRGNLVKQYRPPVNSAIVNLYQQEGDVAGYYVWTRSNLDPALIEFSKDGRVVSALVRIARAGRNSASYDYFLVSKIYMGSTRTYIENKLSNTFLADNYIATR